MFLRILVVACFAITAVQAQDIQYVFAENGLVIREQPNQGAKKVGILDYGTPVEIIEHTNLNLDVQDKDKKVSGQWVKIKGPAAGEYFEEAYIFSGYLTEDKIERPLKVVYEELTVFIDQLANGTNSKTSSSETEENSVFVLKENVSPENRYIKVKHHEDYRSIKVLQRYKNALAVKTKDGKSQISNYQYYTSSWKPLQLVKSSENIFKTITFSDKDNKQFGAVDIEELKTAIGTKDEISFEVVPHRIELKVIMVDIDGDKTEKIINFELPLKA